jgi:hypothetical protein
MGNESVSNSDLENVHGCGVLSAESRAGQLPTIEMTLSQLSEDQRALYEALNLERYRPAA